MGIGRGRLNRAVFFDRDGVLNEAVIKNGRPHPPASLAQLRVDPDAKSELRRLRENGFSIFVVTNQPDVARGMARREDVDAINAAIASELPVDAIYVCYHDDVDECDCRKPRPGMLERAAREHAIDLARSYLVGDRAGDVAAGRSVMCRTVWLDRGYKEKKPRDADARVLTLGSACDWILDDCKRKQSAGADAGRRSSPG